jgi:hypothetical protein
MRTIDEAKEKGTKVTALAKMNKWPHHLGMIGFAGHRKSGKGKTKLEERLGYRIRTRASHPGARPS